MKSNRAFVFLNFLVEIAVPRIFAAEPQFISLAAEPAKSWPLKPALVGDSTNSFAAILRYPPNALDDRLTGAVFFYCDVDGAGKASNFQPFRVSTNTLGFLTATKQALEQARFEPATANGKPTRVNMEMAVFFMLQRGEAQIRIFMNAEEQAIVAGENLIAPQVIGGSRDFSKGIRYPLRALDQRLEGEVKVEFVIDEDGRPSQFKIVKDTAPQAGFSSRAVKHLKESRFIPAFSNGRPVKMRSTKEYIFIIRSIN
jgi:TonB family protein